VREEEVQVAIGRRWYASLLLLLWSFSVSAQPPSCTDPRLVIELVAKEPEIVTPTGIVVDEDERVWIIENNTHERPPNYQGAPSDRIRVFSQFNKDGKPTRVSTFGEGFTNSMGLTLGSHGAVYLVTRSEIYLLRDKKGSGVADQRQVIIKLNTEATYPHNGLCGFAWDGLGNLYFGLGENRGADYKLVGSDGTTLSGGGEGGSIYRCRPDGTGLVRVATGFWNPFHLAVDAFGRLFAVDNDPDSRGPCRLMHIIQGGDYGYRYRNGRKGIHPFTAWNGELPGTLPMVAGTGEAPCGIVAYESTGLPAEYRGDLLVTSWGDHVIERFRLTDRGASFASKAETVVRGGEDFRPVGIAPAPDGSLYISDWVDKSYPVHGKGRIWRLRMKTPPKDDGLRPSQVSGLEPSRLRSLLAHPNQAIRMAAGDGLLAKNTQGSAILADAMQHAPDSRARIQALWSLTKLGNEAASLLAGAQSDHAAEVRAEAIHLMPAQTNETALLDVAAKDPSPFVRMQAILQLRSAESLKAIMPLLADKDPFLAGAALEVLSRQGNSGLLIPHIHSPDPKLRVGLLLALRRTGEPGVRINLRVFLGDADPGVRRAAIQWVGEEKLHQYADLAKAAAYHPPVTREVFEAYLATLDYLSGRKRKADDEPSGDEFIAKLLTDRSQPPAIRSLALRTIRADHPILNPMLLHQCLADKDPGVRAEAVRILATRSDEGAQADLRQVAADDNADRSLRLFAIVGLGNSAATSPKTRRILFELLEQPEFACDALRSLGGIESTPDDVDHLLRWWKENAKQWPRETCHELGQLLVLILKNDRRPETKLATSQIESLAKARPKTDAQWQSALKSKGDPSAGERVFFHPHGPRCFACHRIDGRGAAIGPDLSYVGRSTSREKLIESILAPSKEIAPQFTSWQLVTRDGKVHIGMMVEEGPNSTVTLADNQGKLETIHRSQIDERHALPTSIMPDNLHELMTPKELRDLIEFLCERK
jgi:putative membrane-bound dehydrogenase-like protein